MLLRPAVPADVPLLQHWSTQPHIVAASGDFSEFDWQGEIPRRVDWREILIAEIDGRPIGVMQIIDPAREETHYWGDSEENLRAIDIWIGEAEDLGKGYGTQMMKLAIERCFADPKVTAILIDPLPSNVRARRFYERLGFSAVERRTFGDDECIVHRLERETWEKLR